MGRGMSVAEDKIDCLLECVLANPWNSIIFERIKTLGLNDWWLTAGCIAQSVWNVKYGLPPEYGIIDYDVFYFDPDTSWSAEDDVIRMAATLFSDLPITVQIRNQARVPLWYEGKFGVPFPPVSAASDGIDYFPCKTVAIGVRCDGSGFKVYVPFGVQHLLDGILIPNPILRIPEVYAAKVRRWQDVWSGLIAHPWPTTDVHAAAANSTVNGDTSPPRRSTIRRQPR